LLSVVAVVALLAFSFIKNSSVNRQASAEDSNKSIGLPSKFSEGITIRQIGSQSLTHKTLPNPSEAEDHIAFTNSSPSVPLEWESRVLEAFTNHSGSEEERNSNLKHLAIVEACNVPEVQEVCLEHLAIGLSDNPEDFIELITNQVIPLNIRVGFLKKSLDIRSADLCISITKYMSTNSDYTLKNIAAGYINTHK